jgi:hypothetical protein
VGVSATLLAEHRSRKAVGAPPLKWIRHATLAHCRSPGTLRIEEATQVGANPRNKLFHIGALGLRAASHTAEEGHAGELTLLCSGMTGSSIQNVSSTSMDGGSASCNTASWLSISIPTASIPCICRLVEVLTSTGTYLVPRERSRGTHSITLALDFLWKTLDAFMPLGDMGSYGHVVR